MLDQECQKYRMHLYRHKNYTQGPRGPCVSFVYFFNFLKVAAVEELVDLVEDELLEVLGPR